MSVRHCKGPDASLIESLHLLQAIIEAYSAVTQTRLDNSNVLTVTSLKIISYSACLDVKFHLSDRPSLLKPKWEDFEGIWEIIKLWEQRLKMFGSLSRRCGIVAIKFAEKKLYPGQNIRWYYKKRFCYLSGKAHLATKRELTDFPPLAWFAINVLG